MILNFEYITKRCTMLKKPSYFFLIKKCIVLQKCGIPLSRGPGLRLVLTNFMPRRALEGRCYDKGKGDGYRLSA
jgi:hypothetical protein